MLLNRLVTFVVVLCMDPRVLDSARSDSSRRFKRTMAKRADHELSRLAGEPCSISGGWRHPRQPRSSLSRQHRPLAAHPETHSPRAQRIGARVVCLEGCGSDTNNWVLRWGEGHGREGSGGTTHRDKLRNALDEIVTSKGIKSDDIKRQDLKYDNKITTQLRKASLRAVLRRSVSTTNQTKPQSSSLRRPPRSLGTVWSSNTEGNNSWEQVVPDDQVYKLQQAMQVAADKFAAETATKAPEDYLEEEDKELEDTSPPRASAWGSRVLKVPPSWMSALYLHGVREQLKLKPTSGVELPLVEFSLELWVMPEGGQRNPAIIAGVFDNCSHPLSERGWSVGIRTVDPLGTRNARYFFSLRTDRAVRSTTIYGQRQYRAGAWTHLMATYDGHKMSLYVDGAKVAGSSFQTGNLYSPFMKRCRTLLLGGSQSEHGQGFRGYLGGVVLWHHARSHQDLGGGPWDKRGPVLALWANFKNVQQLWTPLKAGFHPALVSLPAPKPELVSPFLPPPCGLATCDNLDIIHGYNSHSPLRAPKTVRYRIINLANSDGGEPTVSRGQTQLQHQALSEAFHPYNITLELSVHTVRNSTLRQRFILSNCRMGKIGNRKCDPECDHPRTGHDGGDCLHLRPCYGWKRQDGVCNAECNSIHYDYDDGDCCNPEVTDVLRTCFDPESPHRAYMSVKQLKDQLQLSGEDTLNVFFANSAREELAGTATWPWSKEALSHQGGMVLNPAYFGMVGHKNTMIHEMGHIFGLYHVFKGVSERDSCHDPCQELSPSMETGDLCADTAPMPKSKMCQDPGPVKDTCGVTTYQDTPYNNYMSYTDDNCTNHFTPNQVARMHCYIDLVYQHWLKVPHPASLPLAPMVIGHSSDSVSIYWLPPVRGGLYQSSSSVTCSACEWDGVFHQYAHEATSPHIWDTSVYWMPEEAVGPPDVEQPCYSSLQAWSPELSPYQTNITCPGPHPEGCTLTLRFPHPIVPDRLTLWVTYITRGNPALANVELMGDAGESLSLGPQYVLCDTPLTLRLDTHGASISGVKLFTLDEKLEIDAAMLSSGPHSPRCSGCQPLTYWVHRRPSFPEDSKMLRGPRLPQSQLTFTDRSVTKGIQYQYLIQVEAGGVLSQMSPPLLYTHGQSYCGDGLIHGAEECDDANLLDDDGCSKKCRKEMGFNCNGEPSRCYVFEGDGVCEDFERGSSVQDCGFFTPLGFSDQWASSASASHQDPRRCPANDATGEPSLSKLYRSQCQGVSEDQPTQAWFPCTAPDHLLNQLGTAVWLKVGFAHPGVAASVIVYLSPDWSWSDEQDEQRRKTVTILLSDTTNKNHTLGTFELSCQPSPLVANVIHDLSQPFFLTASVVLLFSTPGVAVGGVALRTSCHFNAFALTGCLRQPCQMDSCVPPQLDHASVRCTKGEKAFRCRVECHRGYRLSVLGGRGLPPLQNRTDLVCVHGSWDSAVSCLPVDCGMPGPSHVYHAIFSCPQGTTFNKHCYFTCGAPSILQGDSDRLLCLEDGLWSFPEAYCKIKCPETPIVPHARLLTAACRTTGHNVGATCHYRCDPGYYVTGTLQQERKKVVKVECLDGGQWEESGCDEVICPALPDVFHGMYTCTRGLRYNSSCTLVCPDTSEKSTIHCTEEGVWSQELAMCPRLQGSCPRLTLLNSVEYICEQGQDVGAVCYPSCIVALGVDLHDPVVLTSGSTADSIKHWMTPTKVQSIICTGLLQWFPDPRDIHCIPACVPEGGDGWCDTANNRAFCQYDGGDCCPSSLSTGKVIQFGPDCTEDECTCRDPEAEENKSKTKRWGGQRGTEGAKGGGGRE